MPTMKFMEAITDAIRCEMARDKSVFVMGEDVATPSVSPVTAPLAAEFGVQRVRNTPISELGFTGAAVGAAMAGYRPVLDMRLVDFSLVAMDPIANQAPKLRYMLGGQVAIPIVFRTPQNGGAQNGPTHGQSLESWFMKMPGLKVAVPSGAGDAKGLLQTAIRDDNPVIFVEYRRLYQTEEEVPAGNAAIPFGKAAIKREGNDITLIGLGSQVPSCLEVADALAKDGVSAEVVDPRTLSPLDVDTLAASVAKTGRCVVAEEGHRHGGAGAEIAASLQEAVFSDLKAPIARVAALDAPIPVHPLLEAIVLPSAEKILQKAKEVLRS